MSVRISRANRNQDKSLNRENLKFIRTPFAFAVSRFRRRTMLQFANEKKILPQSLESLPVVFFKYDYTRRRRTPNAAYNNRQTYILKFLGATTSIPTV